MVRRDERTLRRTQGGGEVNGLQMKYFVLKPKGSDTYARASRCALEEYATVIAGENPVLARDIRNWIDQERNAAIAEETGRDRAGRMGERKDTP